MSAAARRALSEPPFTRAQREALAWLVAHGGRGWAGARRVIAENAGGDGASRPMRRFTWFALARGGMVVLRDADDGRLIEATRAGRALADAMSALGRRRAPGLTKGAAP
jgi:hypothetical protein